jgi:hypothetical protein
MTPNKTMEPTPIGAVSSANAGDDISAAWLIFFR